MKLGAESRTKTLIAVVLMLGAGWAAIRAFSGGSAPKPSPAAVARRNAATNGERPAAQQQAPQRRAATAQRRWAYALQPTLDPRLRLDLVQETESTRYEGRGRNIFKPQAEAPVETALAKPRKPEPPPRYVPPPPSQAPPIDLKFYGWASSPGEPKRIFLSREGSVFVAGEGDVIARRYRVVRIHQTSVEIEDVLSNSRQTIPLTQG